ncbi:DUF2304 domain-containing protein [Microbacterium sp. H1-D42]|uniref:DUF2304 domain-containing protein n=1 Tax=Microbacterium sp. H1-D42 TaxID=2925844 RepID=UPI001F52F78F|nr:DUF2304 domain-containing protein [Microbacterium sp. H1-D42]UNK69733.1 DUF2304 domain-containing protein [Microbacterium sp. H1-D42]
MSTITYIFGVVAAVLALIAIIELMRRGTLRERHAGWWFVGGVMALVIAVFPQTLGWAAAALGIVVPINLVFFVAIALLFLVSLQYGAELTRTEEKMRVLAEQSAFHERRIAQLEKRLGGSTVVESDAPRPDGADS